MLKYWLRNSNDFPVTFGNVSEVGVTESQQARFELEHPNAELVGDGSELSEEFEPKSEYTAFGPAFPFGA
jgi:hypothetical protein